MEKSQSFLNFHRPSKIDSILIVNLEVKLRKLPSKISLSVKREERQNNQRKNKYFNPSSRTDDLALDDKSSVLECEMTCVDKSKVFNTVLASANAQANIKNFRGFMHL